MQEGEIEKTEKEIAKQNQRKGNIRNQQKIVLFFPFFTFSSYKRTARFIRAPKCIGLQDYTIERRTNQFYKMQTLRISYRVDQLQNYRVIELQSYKIIELQSHRVVELPSYRVTELQSYRVIKLQSYRVIELQSYKIIELQSYRERCKQIHIVNRKLS